MGAETVNSVEQNGLNGTTPQTPSPIRNPQGRSGLTGDTCSAHRNNWKGLHSCIELHNQPSSELSSKCNCSAKTRICEVSTDYENDD